MGTLAASRLIGWRAALRLGRVSNLPTVWSNVIAGTMLAGGGSLATGLLTGIAMSLLYIGGMYLNDAFDRDIDSRERPSRPIPSGAASLQTVLLLGFGMLAVAVAMLASVSLAAGLTGLALAAAIVVYDLHHKTNPLSPFLMGLCRALVYLGAAASVGAVFATPVLFGAAVLFLFVAGLTLAAKQERLAKVSNIAPLLFLVSPLLLALPGLVSSWLVTGAALLLASAIGFALRLLHRRGSGDVGRAVGLLIAAIALVDALAAASTGSALATFACIALFPLTLLFQRYIPGT
ncbi:UbiA family prenyltransferase [Methyloligella sp. 2.7D]|uniref:UbiA family prenyltransferase n=1 Tax=unclassified Methyloligella TaxID=2625955 RepID=UPI00157CCF07|nr:UbiA family prenyltransferase [Methyloligella sp. GL2]QKP76548.1 UbiA family prenyltransferase [Methyloligella sp. GL2]